MLDEDFRATVSTDEPGWGVTYVYSVVLQADDKIILAGRFTQVDGVTRRNIARLNPDGSLDPSFDPGIGADGSIRSAFLQSDGQLVLIGDFTTVNNVPRASVARVGADGTLDPSYDPLGTNPEMGPFRWLTAATVQQNGRLLVAVFLLDAQCALYRFDQEGRLDSTFTGVRFTNDPLYSASIDSITSQSDGRILVMGAFTSVNGLRRTNFVRLEADGALDTQFAPEVGLPQFANVLVSALPEGKSLVSNGELLRLNQDGSKDQGFRAQLSPGAVINSLATQPDGKVIIGGSFVSADGIQRPSLARLNADGSLDFTFEPILDPLSLADYYVVWSLALQRDGKLLVGSSARYSALALPLLRMNSSFNDPLNYFYFNSSRGYVFLEDSGSAALVVVRAGDTNRVVSVNFETSDLPNLPDYSRATADTDYLASSGRLRFELGERTKTIQIPIRDDTLPEYAESFTVYLSQPSDGASLTAMATTYVQIADNDVRLQFAQNQVSVREDAGYVRIPFFVESLGFQGPFSVDIRVDNGTATAGEDFLATNGTIHFYYYWQEGWLPGSLQVPIRDDAIPEGNEFFTLTLSNPSGGVILGTNRTVKVFILDNDTCMLAEPAGLHLVPPAAVLDGVMRVEAHGQASLPYLLEASRDLLHWVVLSTNATPGCPLIYYDDGATAFGSRFYRLRLPP